MQLHPILDQNVISNLPRVNKQFIGISHQLQLKKRQRRKVQLQEKAIANRVLFLEKQEQRTQKSLQKKKEELKKVMTSIQKKNYQRQQKQRLRNLRQLELQTIRQQNKHRRLLHKQSSFNSKFNIYNNKHNSYEIQKCIMSQKQRQKKMFLEEDHKSKKDHWLTINLDKEKGKQRIDRYYKTKNKEHTQTYLQKIQRQQKEKLKKQTTIKQLQYIQTALRKKLQESTMKVSQIQERLINTSRTIEPTTLSRSPRNSITNNSRSKLNLQANSKSRLQKYQQSTLENMLQKDLIQQLGSRTERNTTSKNNEQEIQQKIQNFQQGQIKGFKIIKTKRKNKHKNRYKQYQLF